MNEYLLASPRRLTYVAAVFGHTTLASIADDAQADQGPVKDALVAQLDRALDYESRGREFESSRARHFPSFKDGVSSAGVTAADPQPDLDVYCGAGRITGLGSCASDLGSLME